MSACRDGVARENRSIRSGVALRCVAQPACTRENRRDFVIVLCASAAVHALQWCYVIIDPAHPATRRRRHSPAVVAAAVISLAPLTRQ